MAADSGNFPSFNNSELSARLALQKRLPFRVPPQPSPFVAHFYPMVNASGDTSPFLPSEPHHLAPNPTALLASVAANRPDLIYTELQNLFKTVGSFTQDVKPDFRPLNESRDPVKEIKTNNFPEGDKFPINDNPFKTPKITKLDILQNSVGSSSLRSFYEGIYSRFTPNDCLLRIRAEQQRIAKESEIQKETTLRNFPFVASPQQISGLRLHGGAFSRTSRHNWNPHQLHQPHFQTRSPPEYPSQTKPRQDGNSSTPDRTPPRPPNITPASPLDFRVHKLHSSSSGYSDSGRRSYSELVEATSTNPEFDFKLNPVKESGMKSVINGESETVATESYLNGQVPDGDNAKATDEPTKIKATSMNSPRELARTSPSASEPRSKRRRRMTSTAETCPVCGITVRASDMKQHFLQEVAKLDKIEVDVYRSSRKVYPDRKTSGSISSSASEHPHTSVTPTSNKNQNDTETLQSINKDNRLKTFQKVRGNRIYRFNNRVGQSQSSVPHGFFPSKVNGGVSWLDYNRNVISHAKSMSYGRFEGVRCPVCDMSLSHMDNHDQISDHVIQCAGSSSRADARLQENEEERDGRHFGEEYEWCGETRVRATALVHRATLASSPGFQVIRNTDNEDSDQDLNVETDETCEYGAAQFTENDLVPPSTSHEEAVPRPGTVDPAGYDAATAEESCCASSSNATTVRSPSCGYNPSQSPSVIVQALRLKIQELENGKNSMHCLICMEPYSKPLVSIQCWHVHCEKCWMRALGVKKLCPQCNMITPTSQLRRIYL